MDITSKQLNTQARTVQLCRWTYEAGGASDKVEIFVDVQPATIGRGYGLQIEYQAFAFEFSGMGVDSQGNPQEQWINRHVQQFLGASQQTAQAQVQLGLDPLLELYKTDPAFQVALASKFPRLTSKFQNILMSTLVPAPVAVKVWKAL